MTATKPSLREEANALTCFAFRNGEIENQHAGEYSDLLENPKLSRITDAEMKITMIESSEKLARALLWKEKDPERYWEHIEYYRRFTRSWVKDEPKLDWSGDSSL